MEAYKFETIIEEDGIIKLPELKKWVNHKVEIFIVDKSTSESNGNINKSFAEFSKKWKGCLKGLNVADYKDERTEYLEDKYK